MALQQFVFGLIVSIVCTSKGGHTSLVCGNVQGPDESPKNWPWQVSIKCEGCYIGFFGGTLINDQWVLTAAVNFQEEPDTNISGLAVSFSGSNVTRAVDAKLCNQSYIRLSINSTNYYYRSSVCLLRLSAPVTFSSNIQPVCLPTQDSTFDSQDSAWVAGWTPEYYGNFKTHTYNEMSASVVGPNECSCRKDTTMPNNALCAEFTNNASLQDLGLPLLVKQDSVWVQAGILIEHCRDSYPCVYTKLSEYQDWIMEVIGSNNQTGFVNVTSSGMDNDFKCTYPIYDIFDSGDRMTPYFSQLLSLCGLTLLLFVMG